MTSQNLCATRRDVLGHIGNKWSALVLTLLEREPRRYSEIRRSCRITPRMLSLTVRELERDGLITHDVVYALTPAGRSLCTIISSLISWSDEHHDYIAESRDRFSSQAAASMAAAIGSGRDSIAM